MKSANEKAGNKLAAGLKGVAWVISLAAACYLPAACGGGGGGAPAPGAAGQVRSVGIITAKGSITVNGVKYETDNADIVKDGTASDDAGLQVGMVVDVSGTINADGVTGTATSVDFDDNVEGFIIEAPDAQTGSFNVLGQTIHTDAATIFHGEGSQSLGFADLQQGDHVEVSGKLDANGDIVATYIEAKQDGDLEITDTIDAIVSETAFMIGSLKVDHAGAEMKSFLQGAPAVGNRVEVKVEGGDLTAFDLATMTLTATSVELQTGLDDSDSDHFDAEGLVKSIEGDSLVLMTDLGAVLNATLNAGCIFEGLSRDSLAVGVRVEVEGKMSGGVLLVSKVGSED